MPRRVLGYARVSSVEQTVGTSLQDQQDAIRAYAKKCGITVAKMYVESESGIHEKIERREQIQALLREVKAGDLVVCDKLDRWSRDPEFTYRSVRELLAAKASFYAVSDACDPSTPEGDTALGFRILFAREEHKRIKQRMVGTRMLLKQKGYYADGLPPFGYARQGDVKGSSKNVLLPNDDAEQVRRIFRLCIKGYSIGHISESLGLADDRVHKILRSRIYLGEVRTYDKEWIKGQHEPIIDHATFLAASEALDSRRYGSRSPRDGAQTSDWWLRDVARCGLCDGKMSAAYGGTPEARRYYYVCRKRCVRPFPLVKVREIEIECEPLVVARLTELREELSAPMERAKARPTTDLRKQLTALESKQARYVEAFSDGAMTRDAMREKLATIEAQKLKIQAAMALPEPVDDADRRAVLKNVATISKAWARTSPYERREIIGGLARGVYLEARQPPRVDWYSADYIARYRQK